MTFALDGLDKAKWEECPLKADIPLCNSHFHFTAHLLCIGLLALYYNSTQLKFVNQCDRQPAARNQLTLVPHQTQPLNASEMLIPSSSGDHQ